MESKRQAALAPRVNDLGCRFSRGQLAHERIYWDQASVLKQIGLLTDRSLPVFGAETAQKLLDPSMS